MTPVAPSNSATSAAPTHGIPAARWLHELERNIPVAREGTDHEGAHQTRVAIARLRVWLDLGGLHVLDDDLRWLRSRIAQLRDLDVQLEHEPPARWAAALRHRRARAQRDVIAALDDARVPSLIAALTVLPPVPEVRARDETAHLARRVLRRARDAAHRSDLAAFHRLRRAVRRLRFALEWLDEDTTTLVFAQDTLGETCDLQVALANLRKSHDAHTGPYRAKLKHERRIAEQRAREALRILHDQLEEIASCSSS